MPHYKYLIVGGGMAADAAAKQIRQIDADGAIGIISADVDPPYKRPPLSKSLWKGKDEDSIWLKTEDAGVSFHLGRKAQQLDSSAKRIVDDQHNEYFFDKLLLATGGTPRQLSFGGDAVIYYRTAQDYRRLRSLTSDGDEFVVIGGGFIGWEVAAALAMNDKHVTMIFPEAVIGSKVYPREIGEFLSSFYRGKGIDILSGDIPTAIEEGSDHECIVNTREGRKVAANGVIAGLGITPNVDIAESADIAVDNGIVVDEILRTSNSDVYAAGDVANFYNPALDMRMRVEHEDNALVMGAIAGRAMTGNEEPYTHLPFFYSDLFELGYEAVGRVDARLETIIDWRQQFEEGVIYYMENERVRGVLLWNVWEKVDEARELIAQPGPFSASDLRGRIHA